MLSKFVMIILMILIWSSFNTNNLFVQAQMQPNISNIDQTLKLNEMRDTVVSIETYWSDGSGTIIDYHESKINGIYEYIVLTNNHVTKGRLINQIDSVNCLTGEIIFKVIDSGCLIVVFDHYKQKKHTYTAKVIAEDALLDLSILSFESTQLLPIANIATIEMLDEISVFDEIFTISCQFAMSPTPTTGIISQIIKENHNNLNFIIYGNTAHITPGSSGGAIFRKYGNHYYMIAIPYKTIFAYDSKYIPHLSYGISMVVAKDFIRKTLLNNE